MFSDVFIHLDDGKHTCLKSKNFFFLFLFTANSAVMRPETCVALGEAHQQTLVSEQDGVGEGRTRAVVTGDKDGVQTARSSGYLWNLNRIVLSFLANTRLKYYEELLLKTTATLSFLYSASLQFCLCCNSGQRMKWASCFRNCLTRDHSEDHDTHFL